MTEHGGSELDKGLHGLPVQMLLVGLLLGLLADRLFGEVGPMGPGFLLWSAAFGVAVVWVLRRRASLSGMAFGWVKVATFAAFMTMFRSTPWVILGLLLVMVVAMGMIFLQVAGRRLADSVLSEHLQVVASVPFQALLGSALLMKDIDAGSGIRHPAMRAGLRGALLALPLLLVFIALFNSADASFSRLTSGIADLLSQEIMRHFLLTLLLAWLATGLLAGVASRSLWSPRPLRSPFSMASIDTAVFMGLLVAVFLVFVLLQLGYLFGGRETIEAVSGLTLAEYARRGFFELLMVAGLTLFVLVAVAATGCNERVFRPLAAILLACVLVVMVSALQRLLLYIDAFGLTIDRLVACAVLAWVAFGLLLFGATLLRGAPRFFAGGLTTSGVAVVFLFALLNPAAIVARVNIERTAALGLELDGRYLLDLGPDAVPVILERLDSVPLPRRCIPVGELREAWHVAPEAEPPGARNWRAWNYSRSRARGLVDDSEPLLNELLQSCGRGAPGATL